MGKFLEKEKIHQTYFKIHSDYFSDNAKVKGIYKGEPRAFCLPPANAEENLFYEIRKPAIKYFKQCRIKWHDGKDGNPSNHLCDSQVCCVNFLFPFIDHPNALVELLRPIFPKIKNILLMEKMNIEFEWIGKKNYLKEKIAKNRNRTRGANFTSADAAIMFENSDGNSHIILIEWKYTESYGGTFLKYSSRDTDRTKIYHHLYERNDSPIDKSLLLSFDALFYEPFYQLMRQQFLAYEMERASELGAKIVSVLHISPAANKDFNRITSPALTTFGNGATDVWKKLLTDPEKFKTISTEEMFGTFPIDNFPHLKNWWVYLKERYSWL